MRYGSAKMDADAVGVARGAGVPGFDAAGVGGRNESVADNAGEGIMAALGPVGIAMRGEGAAMPPTEEVTEGFAGDGCGVLSCTDEGGTPISTSTEISVSDSSVIVFGSLWGSAPHTCGLSS
ncbi:hypothetical protein GSI_08934 [Ganoderma sinense ZZ0214-1]|uniref:Uncharacterized protein n=1 Tax=Ganoderma sinense ZZ0214-1 TaxID=1077348 RepID=A0A2G8S5S4_9APHY|nr:hypothetical protein GSI_08934 [Ganoderma sinense ZZ0214-1]